MLGIGVGLRIGLGLGTGIADLNLTYLRLLSTTTYHISYGVPEPAARNTLHSTGSHGASQFSNRLGESEKRL